MAVVRGILARIAAPAGAIGLIALIAAGVVYIAQNELTPIARALLIIGGLGLLAFIWGSPASLGGLATSRTTRYGSLSLLTTAAFIGILIVANLWVARRSPRWDLTQAQLYSLAPQTKELLQRLGSPVRATAFVPADDARKQRAEDLLKEYAAVSPQFTYEIVDPDTNPSLATRYNIRNYGDTVFTGNGVTQTATIVDEQNFTSALLKTQSPTSLSIYFLTGHGERSIDTFGDTDYSTAKRLLVQDNFAVNSLNLITETTIPANAAALVIAEAKQPLLPQEVEQLTAYLRRGGSLLVLTDVGRELPAKDLLSAWGVGTQGGVAVDPASAFFGDASTPVVQGNGYQLADITKDLGPTFFPLATMVTGTYAITSGATLRPLLQTSSASWLEMDPNRAEFTDGVDRRGPIPLGWVVQGNAPDVQQPEANPDQIQRRIQTRIVVYGDADFASNVVINRGLAANADLFVNTVQWLTQSDQLVSIRPKPPTERNLVLTGQQQLWLFLSSVVLLPAIVLVAGTLVWWGRR